ncbi:hypothetical protein CALVIDRAFT_603584 [Calocera viscosa TUFC12733]|uniref:FAD-binding FR-type domain-containing protein n=1 Tax=Calocera viscosa (strain TUFC12733) TaxID=1330018 RepID=A0A167FIA2_CALVF|nr:hypothetical protein CALVIDRAFT_603584 [Calocera viscosa TUFC12733]
MLSTTGARPNGWHPGELAVQNLLALPQLVSPEAIVQALPRQHSLFHSTRLHFVPMTTLDRKARPWTSILTARDGTIGFISSSSETGLTINAGLWPGDPIAANLSGEAKNGKNVLISGVGVELTTRRRNKFGGYVQKVLLEDMDLTLEVFVNEALGQCPKYINIRTLASHPSTSPELIYEHLDMDASDRLPAEVISFVHASDAVYLATSYVAAQIDAERFPSHLGTNHRGGRPGFVRVRPSDGRTLALPNYSGNRLLNSLGNIQVTPLAGLTFPDFATGSILYITGNANTLWGKAAQDLMPGCNILTTITATGFVFVRNALPVRHGPGIDMEKSPYCPPIRYLAEEDPPARVATDVDLQLISATIHSWNLGTFTFEAAEPLVVLPAQSAVFDLSDVIRERAQKFIPLVDDPRRANDDCVRTWTISVPTSRVSLNTFSITIREKNEGLATHILFEIARTLGGNDAGGFVDLRSYDITAKLRSLGADHYALDPVPAAEGGRRLLWAAGGIGITPFLNLLDQVCQLVHPSNGAWDIVLVVSTREPDVTLQLIWRSLSSVQKRGPSVDVKISIYLFSHRPVVTSPLPNWVSVTEHTGRVQTSPNFFKDIGATDRDCHICGPLPFIQSVMAGLELAGVDAEVVRRERFTY